MRLRSVSAPEGTAISTQPLLTETHLSEADLSESDQRNTWGDQREPVQFISNAFLVRIAAGGGEPFAEFRDFLLARAPTTNLR